MYGFVLTLHEWQRGGTNMQLDTGMDSFLEVIELRVVPAFKVFGT